MVKTLHHHLKEMPSFPTGLEDSQEMISSDSCYWTKAGTEVWVANIP